MYQNYAGRAFVVGLRDGLEPLLSGGVPYLHLDSGSVDVQSLDLEVNSDRRDVGHLVLLIYKSQEDVGLPHRRVADNHHFDEEIVLVLLFLPCLLCHLEQKTIINYNPIRVLIIIVDENSHPLCCSGPGGLHRLVGSR